jgi:pimeloyl-ACP methyl ester carboxylesterase
MPPRRRQARLVAWGLAASCALGLCARGSGLPAQSPAAVRARPHAASQAPRGGVEGEAAAVDAPEQAAATGGLGQGFTLSAELKHAAFRRPGVPSVGVHAAPGFDPRAPLHLVVFLHGYNGCVSVLMAAGRARCAPRMSERDGWDLGRLHAEAGTRSLLIVPQLAFAKRDGRPGAFGRAGGFRAFLDELLSETLAQQLGGGRRRRDIASLTLIAHSAGYQTALAIAERGGVRALRAIVLLDALYADTDRYGRLLESPSARGLRFVSLYLQRGTPRRENERLYRRLRAAFGNAVADVDTADLERGVSQHRIVFGLGRPPHAQLPQHHMATLVRALLGVISRADSAPGPGPQ